MKTAYYLLVVGWGALIWGASIHGKAESEHRILQESLMIERGRSALLQDEIGELSRRPTYEQGYRDAIIRAGTPEAPGNYKDGYYAGFLSVADAGYADGYHAALEQFGHKENPRAKLPLAVSMEGKK
jgi:hypothetical protein